MKSNKHESVLLDESIAALNIKSNGIYVDATLGRGGHTAKILDYLDQNGLIIGIDQDRDAIEYCKSRFKDDRRVVIVEDNFSNLKNILHNLKIDYVDGILMDLGVSSPQVDNPERGFSYVLDGPLDMRMDQSQTLSAKVIVNQWSAEQLHRMFRRYGDIVQPNKVVKSIISNRALKPIETTGQLVEIIRGALSPKELMLKNKHPEKVYFQALRIATNDELHAIKEGIISSAASLNLNGVLVVISFHSLEDKIVLEEFKKLSENKLPKEIPLNENWRDFEMIKPHGVKPTATEVSINPRSTSAKLRILKKIKMN